ncbi:hypothetical protein ACCM60_14210 [Pseudomonas chlororaphis subsp. aureofaciens]|uniref:hypothetical protein n=1 Tax=Pseudomonas chlororaphis TaxID=587753 RepID=UPI00355608A4
MTDYSELKHLAEAMKGWELTQCWPVEESESDWEVGGVTDGERYPVLTIDTDQYDAAYLAPAIARYYSTAHPAAVLDLIAENERVKARLCVCRDCGGQGEIYSGHDSYQGYNQPPEPDMDVCGTCGGDGVLGPLEDFESLAAECDKLKAENETLLEIAARATYETWSNEPGYVPWIERGNSLKQEEARAMVRAAMSKGEQA